MQVLRARERRDDILFRVWLDTTKVTVGNQPDAKYVRDYTFSPLINARHGLAMTQYLEELTQTVRQRANADLAAISPPGPAADVPLPQEGMML